MEEEADTDQSHLSFNFSMILPSPVAMEEVVQETKSDNDQTTSPNLPSIVDVPFHIWLRRMTADDGPFPGGMFAKQIRDMIEEQWRKAKSDDSTKSTKRTENYWGHKSHLYVQLHNEVKAGRIFRLAKGIYSGKQNKKPKKKMRSRSSSNASSKKLKRRTGPPCSLCNNKRHDGTYIQCSRCDMRWHIVCARKRSLLPDDFMKIAAHPKQLARKLLDAAGNWLCYSCKRCRLCQGGEEADNSLLVCDHCDTAEHFYCQKPVPKSVPYAPWYCGICRAPDISSPVLPISQDPNERLEESQSLPMDQGLETVQDEVKQKKEIGGGTLRIGTITKRSSSALGTSTVEAPKMNRRDTQSIYDHPVFKDINGADIKLWDVDKIFSVLTAIGYNEVAQIFKNEEIDGAALLLLKRDDVMYKMKLKLGPALKVHRVVNHLQALYGVSTI